MTNGMNALYHTWEMGQSSWRQLSEMLLVANKVTVWGPTFEQILDASKNHGMPYSPDQFLELVKQGFIKVAARPNWYAGAAERERLGSLGYLMTPWRESFDGELAKIENQEQVELIAAPNDDVNDWVQIQIDGEGECYRNAVARIRAGRHPRDWHEVAVRKLQGSVSEEGLVRLALSTAHHHLLAARALECNAAVENLEDAGFFANLEAYPRSATVIQSDAPRIRFEELLYHLSRVNFRNLSSNGEFDRHIQVLHELSEIKRHLQDFTGSSIDLETDVLAGLRRRIDEAVQPGPGYIEMSVYTALAVAGGIGSYVGVSEMSRRNFLKGSLIATAAVGSALSGAMPVIDGVADWSKEGEVTLDARERAMLLALAGPNVLEKIPQSAAEDLFRHIEMIKNSLPFYNKNLKLN